VNQLSPLELQAIIESGQSFHLYDVRTPEEHQRAHIADATLVDARVAAEIEKLPKDALIVFHCHHGGRSQAAAEHFASAGFTNVHNLAGGTRGRATSTRRCCATSRGRDDVVLQIRAADEVIGDPRGDRERASCDSIDVRGSGGL
jgi:rhodanese-related sulfurtransferase